LRFRSTSAEATTVAASALAECIPEGGLTIALVGPLGAGKTAFVKGLAAGLGLEPGVVSSPTFVIANQYDTPSGRGLAHVDLYRLEAAAELDDIGFADMLEPGTVVAVEWADRLPGALPVDRLEVRIERASGSQESRSFAASATGKGSQQALDGWQSLLAGESPVSSVSPTLELL
jgi:tRNA threonylcarbamoyladenosine biosynthesis protein TsaE